MVLLLLLVAEGVLQLVGLFYSPESTWEPSKEGTIPILCIGDSHTYGLDVLEPFKYPNRLHVLLNGGREKERYQVVSRGVPGRNTPVMRQKLPGYLDRIRPKAVLILGGYNNSWNSDGAWIWNGGFSLDTLLSKFKVYRFIKLALRNLKGTSDGGFRIASDGGEGFNVIEGGEERAINQGEGSAPGLRTGKDLERVTRVDLEAMVSVCREHGAAPVLLTYAMTGGDFDPVNEAARAAADASGAPLIDLAAHFEPLIEREGRERLFFEHKHLRERGYELAAGFIAGRLVEEGLADEPPGGNMTFAPPSKGELDLRLEIDYEGDAGEPVLVVNGAEGVTFLVILCEKPFKGGKDLAANPENFAALEGSRLVEFSRATPSFTGTFTGVPLRLKVPAYFKKDFRGRRVFGCLLALNRYASETAPLVLGATESLPVSLP